MIAEDGALARLGDARAAATSVSPLVADERVLELHRPGLGERLVSTHTVPSGEQAKQLAVCGGSGTS